MFKINCKTCGVTALVSNTRIQSTHQTSEGMIAYVRCACGRTVIHRLEPAYPKPPPPASVVAMRQAIEARESDKAV